MSSAPTRFMMLIAVAAALTVGGCASPPTMVSTREQLRSTEGQRVGLKGTVHRIHGKGYSPFLLTGEFGDIEMHQESFEGLDAQEVEIVGRVSYYVQPGVATDDEPFSPIAVPQGFLDTTCGFVLVEIESIRAIDD